MKFTEHGNGAVVGAEARPRSRSWTCLHLLLVLVFGAGAALAEDSSTSYHGDGWIGFREPDSTTPCIVKYRDMARDSEVRVAIGKNSSRELTLHFPKPVFKGATLAPIHLQISSSPPAELTVLAEVRGGDSIVLRDVYPSGFWNQVEGSSSLRVLSAFVEWTFPIPGYDDAARFLDRCSGRRFSGRDLDPRGGPVPVAWLP